MMMRLWLLVLLLSSPFLGIGQVEEVGRKQKQFVPWLSGISTGFSLWPTAKERLRLGYSWEIQPNRHWLHELTYVYAEEGILFPREQFGYLEGGQLRNEFRFYQPYSRRSILYFSLGLSYMYGRHRYSFTEGKECDAEANCAYFRRYRYVVPTHTATLQGNVGMVLTASSWFKVDFFAGVGLRNTYFPLLRTDAHFGKGRVLADSEQMVLEPYVRLGINLFFVLSQRKDFDKDL